MAHAELLTNKSGNNHNSGLTVRKYGQATVFSVMQGWLRVSRSLNSPIRMLPMVAGEMYFLPSMEFGILF